MKDTVDWRAVLRDQGETGQIVIAVVESAIGVRKEVKMVEAHTIATWDLVSRMWAKMFGLTDDVRQNHHDFVLNACLALGGGPDAESHRQEAERLQQLLREAGVEPPGLGSSPAKKPRG